MPYLKKELGMTRERHLFVQGVPFPIPEPSLWRGQIQKERMPKAFHQSMGSEYMLPDLNASPIPRAKPTHLFARERTKHEAEDVAAMLRRLGKSGVVSPEISLTTRHYTGIFEVWTDEPQRGRRKRR